MTAWPSTASKRQSVAAAIAGHSGRDCCRMRRTPAARFVCVVSLGVRGVVPRGLHWSRAGGKVWRPALLRCSLLAALLTSDL